MSIARIIGERMRATLGQPLVVENVSGAGGSIGVGRVARAAPDGYTLSIGQLNSHVFSGAAYNVRYDLLKDFDPVALLTTNPQMIVGKKDLPAKDMKELICMAQGKSRQRKLMARPVSAALRMFGASTSKTIPAPASSSCRIAALRPPCRICWRGRLTSHVSRPRICCLRCVAAM